MDIKHNENGSLPRPAPDIPALTGLRFVAAFYVVLFHSWPVLMPQHTGPLYWNQFLQLGYVAVSLFFVLSGMILATVYLGEPGLGPIRKTPFFEARFARIYPVYMASMLISAPFAFVKADAHGSMYHNAKALFLIIVNASLLQAWHPALSGNWNRPSWSVSVETFFYLIFPVAGVWIIRSRIRPLLLAALLWLLSVASSVTALSMLPNASTSFPRMEILLFNPLLRLPEFLIGICIAVWLSRTKIKPSPHIVWGVLATFLLTVPLLARLPMLLVSNGLLAPFFGLAIISLSISRGPAARLLASPVFVRLGQASYSLYLFHLPVLLWMTAIVRGGNFKERLTGPWPINNDSPAYLLLYITSSVCLSLLSYRFLESPARSAVRAWFQNYKGPKAIRSYHSDEPRILAMDPEEQTPTLSLSLTEHGERAPVAQ